MHRSGISVSQELKSAFDNAHMGSIGYVFVKLENETFSIVSQGEGDPNDASGSFAAIQQLLEPKKPSYGLVRHQDKWVMISYMPEASAVKEKMLYASSRSSLKEDLGAQRFTDDFFISIPDECTLHGYLRSTTDEDKEELLTFEERMRKQAIHSSVSSAENVRLTAMNEIPIKVGQSTLDEIKAFSAASANAEAPSRVLFLDLDQETETLTSFPTDAQPNAESIREVLKQDHAKVKKAFYVLLQYAHQTADGAGSACLFIYYCPEAAPPRIKMFFSSAKSMVSKLLTDLGIVIVKNLQMSDPKEFTDETFLDELYPKQVEKKIITKPKPAGRKPRTTKFTPTQS